MSSINPVDEKLPLARAAPLGLQHMLAIFAGTITVPLIVAQSLELNAADTTLMIQATLFISGLGTLLQSMGIGPVGARLPLVLGTSFAYIGIAIAIGKNYGLSAIFGAALIAGFVQAFVGFIIRYLRFLFPPLITGLYILLIGISILPIGFALACGGSSSANFGAPQHTLLAGFVLVIAVLTHQFTRGMISMASIIIAMSAGYLVSFFFWHG